MTSKEKKLNAAIEDALTDLGVSNDDLRTAKLFGQRSGAPLEKTLVTMGALDETRLPEFYSEVTQSPQLSFADLQDWTPPPLDGLPADFLIKRNWVPFTKNTRNDQWIFATSDPLNWNIRQWLSQEIPGFSIAVCSEEGINTLRTKLDVDSNAIESDPDSDDLTDLEESELRELASEAPTVNLLNALFLKAVRQNASDLHLEPINGKYRARLRIDGVLHKGENLPRRLQLAVVSRIKILAGMDIAEKRRPQDGKIELKAAGVNIDIRVSCLPLNELESVVLRFLRKDSLNFRIEEMHFNKKVEGLILEDLASTSGVVLLTGPTGSGKTSSLYTFLNRLNTDQRKIITLEDPVEYQLPGLNQVQVHPELGYDFAKGLRAVVRQDPDVIMVGEIRDKETCQIAMQAALTGHLVFSTVHTNDAASAYTRLLDLGVEEFLLNAAIVSIIAQRLARRLCSHCKVPTEKNREYLADTLKTHADKVTLFEAVGCELCGHTGFKGRIAITEYLRCSDKVKSLPKDEYFLLEVRKHQIKNEMPTLKEDGFSKAAQGLTTIEEVLRVANQ